MARKPEPTTAHEPEASPANQAFGAARAFVERLATLAYHARHFQPDPDKPDAWQDPAMTYAMAFVAWYDLSHLLTPAVRTEARRVYPPGAASIKLVASNEAAPVVPAMPASVENGLAAYRRVTLGATPYPTVIEAVADELGVYFRNAVYAGRRHPLEPDRERVADEAKARAKARQVAQGKPAEPFGWGADFDELMKKETCAAVRARLGIKTPDHAWTLMADEWKKQDREEGETTLSLLRCNPINFPDLRMQLIREAEAVIAAASKPNTPTIDPAILARLEAAKLPRTRRGFQRLAETTTRDQPIIAGIRDGKSYRQVARECNVSKTTVGRVAVSYGLTGHARETVPLDGTLEENLSVRGRTGKRGSR